VTSEDTFAQQTLLVRIGQAEEVAEAIMFLLSDKSSYVTGGTVQSLSLTN
jgi:NAD(P)-dependent dehydrogenase (short-subunit alcohol dehydrogenase family)